MASSTNGLRSPKEDLNLGEVALEGPLARAGQERGLFVGQTSIELRLLAYVCLRKMGTVIRSNQL